MSRQHITIGFSTRNLLVSKAIRWITQGACSHAWFCYNEQVVEAYCQPIRKVAQAEWFGYETRPRWRWNKRNTVIAEFELIGFNANTAVHTMINNYLGSKYDYKAAALTGLWHLLKRSTMSKFKNPSKLMCSEGVIRLLNHAGYAVAKNIDPETTSPKTLMVRCFQYPHELRLLYAAPQVLKKYGIR